MTTDGSNRLDIDVERRDSGSSRVSWVRVRGELDLANSDDLATALRSRSCEDSDVLVLDLRELQFMDSSGVRVVLLYAEERKPAVRMVIEPGSAISKLFDVINVDRHVSVADDEEEAMSGIEQVNGSG
jgi:anti-anti-sigma factor